MIYYIYDNQQYEMGLIEHYLYTPSVWVCLDMEFSQTPMTYAQMKGDPEPHLPIILKFSKRDFGSMAE